MVHFGQVDFLLVIVPSLDEYPVAGVDSGRQLMPMSIRPLVRLSSPGSVEHLAAPAIVLVVLVVPTAVAPGDAEASSVQRDWTCEARLGARMTPARCLAPQHLACTAEEVLVRRLDAHHARVRREPGWPLDVTVARPVEGER